jgi:hypothetical protein
MGLLQREFNDPMNIQSLDWMKHLASNTILLSTRFLYQIIFYIKIEDCSYKKLTYQIYELSGKFLVSEKISGQEAIISMREFVPSAYFLKILLGNKAIEVFKIVKK